MTASDKPPIFTLASSARPQTYPVLRGTAMFDSPYPPMPQRGDTGAPMPPPVHTDQQYSQLRTHDRRAMPRRATTGVVPPQVLSSRRNASGPVDSGRFEGNRSLMFYGQPIDTASAQAGTNSEFGDSSDDDPISATILDNASVPMFMPPRLSSLARTESSINQSLPEYPSISSVFILSISVSRASIPSLSFYGTLISRSFIAETIIPSKLIGTPISSTIIHRAEASISSGSPQSQKGLQESPSRVPREFPQAATAFAAAIQEAEHRLHNSSWEDSKEDTDPEGVAHFKNLDGMFDEIKKLSICSEDNGKGTISRWTFASKLARPRPSILKDLPSSVAPEKGKGKGKDSSPTIGAFSRSRKDSMSAEKPKTRPRKDSVSTDKPKKRNVSGLWKRGSDSSAKPAFTKPAETRFSLDEEVNRPNMGDFAMVDFVWSLKSSCPVTKNITQYGEWERMAGEDGRSDEFSLLNPPQ
ncbi:uncharacterized protein H6S33_003820 [Morchella sextelata]|uniref:uncharacterized protein n=1 Tax=Morchella sextelata TaxID=1174677 RepID=UPI001D03C56C|nr:uncharacterized protein H6S33_003820 [Morchella sextelata]KAH0606159.1 hypothetical protein H6S33_003820 [Morchella sextelata]